MHRTSYLPLVVGLSAAGACARATAVEGPSSDGSRPDGGATPRHVSSGGSNEGGSAGFSPVETGGYFDLGDTGVRSTPADAACAEVGAAAEVITRPADLIWAVDQSGSMDQETQYVAARMNEFVTAIEASKIDYHVVMIASTAGSNALCVPAPLAKNCGNGERFRLVDKRVGSHDALRLVVETYPQYADFLRPNAQKHFIVVTDDNATASPIDSAQAFTDAVAGFQPAGMFASWKFHAVYSFGPRSNGCQGPFGDGAAYGHVYEALVRQTSGAQGAICDDNWQPVFDAITTAVVDGSKVSCEYSIPSNSDGGAFDHTRVNVEYLPGGHRPAIRIYRLNNASECVAGGGWYFDDTHAPTKIFLCPGTCTAIQADAQARVEARFGCLSVFKPPA